MALVIRFLINDVKALKYKNIQMMCCYSTETQPALDDFDEFKPLNLRTVATRTPFVERKHQKAPVMPPREKSMPVDQDWSNVWPAPRSFHPATVPLPVRQGFVEKGVSPGKYANAELMKIPNFLHLTPPAIKKHCEALKQFCTPWPQGLETDEKCEMHFPITVISSNYCHSSPTIRDTLARIVAIKIKLSKLKLDAHAKDKFLRIIGERYNEETDEVTIVADRCPTRQQNYDYAMYLLTACYHESWVVEPWEKEKTEDDMEYYDWDSRKSKSSILTVHSWNKDNPKQCVTEGDVSSIPHITEFKNAVNELRNNEETDKLVLNYGVAVRNLLNLPQSL